MEVPRSAGYNANQFRLCFSCHNELDVVGVPNGYGYQLSIEPPEYLKRDDISVAHTNFRNEETWDYGWA